MFVVREYMRDIARPMKGLRVVVQGFGNVGSNLALLLEEEGCEVFAVSDVYGGIIGHSGKPLPIKELVAHVNNTGSVIMFPGAESIDNQDLLLLECDVLAPAALECALHQDNAAHVKAKVIAEAANLPTTPEADEVFAARGITVLPDILTNVGGVVVSYFEWAQNLQQTFWSEERVNEELYRCISATYRQVASLAARDKIPFKAAAYEIAVDRVARAERLRGI